MNNRQAAAYAEFTLSPAYREVENVAYLQEEQSGFPNRAQIRDLITEAALSSKDEIAAEVLVGKHTVAMILAEEMKNGKMAHLVRDMSLKGLEPFYDFEFERGEPGPVHTNTIIVRLADEIEDPVEFLVAANEHINMRRSQGRNFVGIENPTTAIHLFVKKIKDISIQPNQLRANSEFRDAVNDVDQLVFHLSENDSLNAVEIGNLSKFLPIALTTLKEPRTHAVLAEAILEAGAEVSDWSCNLVMRSIAECPAEVIPSYYANVVRILQARKPHFDNSGEYVASVRAVSKVDPALVSVELVDDVLDKSVRFERLAVPKQVYRCSVAITRLIESASENSHLRPVIARLVERFETNLDHIIRVANVQNANDEPKEIITETMKAIIYMQKLKHQIEDLTT